MRVFPHTDDRGREDTLACTCGLPLHGSRLFHLRKRPLCASIRSYSSPAHILSWDVRSSVTSSRSTSSSSSLALSTTSAVNASTQGLNPSKPSTRDGIHFFQSPANGGILKVPDGIFSNRTPSAPETCHQCSRPHESPQLDLLGNLLLRLALSGYGHDLFPSAASSPVPASENGREPCSGLRFGFRGRWGWLRLLSRPRKLSPYQHWGCVAFLHSWVHWSGTFNLRTFPLNSQLSAVWHKGPTSWPLSAFDMPSSLSLVTSGFWFKVTDVWPFPSLTHVEATVGSLISLISVLLCLREQGSQRSSQTSHHLIYELTSPSHGGGVHGTPEQL